MNLDPQELAALQKLHNDIDGLIPPGLRQIPNQREGLIARLGDRQVSLSNVDKFGMPLNFTTDHRDFIRNTLLAKFPHLDASVLLARSSESIRRYNSVKPRLEAAQKDAAAGKVIALESLDMSAAKPRPLIPAGQLAATEPGKIPRAMTYVRPTGPNTATRIIIFSDLPLYDPILKKTIIPDEIVVSYEMGVDELEAVKTANPPATFTPLKEITVEKVAKRLRITCGDINKELVGSELVRHFEKTMRGLVAAITMVTDGFGIVPDGIVRAEAIDSLMHSGEFKFTDELWASAQRRTARGTKTSLIAEFAQDAADASARWKAVQLEPIISGSAVALAQRLGMSMVVVATVLEEVLNSLPKKKL